MTTRSILFLCGSLNAGKNGVGDYTRLLASYLQARGCRICIIASHDHEIEGIVEAYQLEGEEEISTLRISRQVTHTRRWECIRHHIARFDPEVVSLQFVPFSFDMRGLPYPFIRELTTSPLRDRQWHIMFHELWVGWESGLAPKRRLLALGQQWLIKKLYRALQPAIVHTHLPKYIDDLKEIGIPARPLPLYANVATGAPQKIAGQAVPEGIFRLAFFSQMDISQPVATFIGDLIAGLPPTHPGELEVLLIGGNAAKIAATRASLESQFSTIRVVSAGFLSNEALLERLGSVHMGITPVPLHALGKSGTVAAFLMRRVPVAAPKVTKQHPPFLFPEFNDAIFTKFTPEAYLAARAAAQDLPIEWITPQRIALNFMEDLQQLGLLSLPNVQKNHSRS